jgi:hypothetical protein
MILFSGSRLKYRASSPSEGASSLAAVQPNTAFATHFAAA